MADLAKIVDDLSSLSVLEAAQLSKMLEEKWGVSAAATVAACQNSWYPKVRGKSLGRCVANTSAPSEYSSPPMMVR
jgi:ribosomal protein L7/L12